MARVSLMVGIVLCSVAVFASAQSDHERISVERSGGTTLFSSCEMSISSNENPQTPGRIGLGITFSEVLVLRQRIEIAVSVPMKVDLTFRENRLLRWALDATAVSSHAALRLGGGRTRSKIAATATVEVASDGAPRLPRPALAGVGVIGQVSRISDPVVIAHRVALAATLGPEDRRIQTIGISATTTLVEVLNGATSLICAVGLSGEVYPEYGVYPPTVSIAYRRKVQAFAAGAGIERGPRGNAVLRTEVEHEWN